MEFNLADLYECLCDAAPDREVLVAGHHRLTFAELDARANRLAHHLLDAGVRAGDHVGIYSWNRAEHVEAYLACWKMRAVAINVNYRYVAAEMRYLIDNADMVAMIYERQYGPLLAELAPGFPALATFVVLDDGDDVALDAVPGAVEYEAALAAASPERGFVPRSGDDLYMLYTGGTTGMPKGVMWRQEDIFFAAMSIGAEPPATPEAIAQRIVDGQTPTTSIATAPLMHGSAQWTLGNAFFGGNRCVLYCEHGFNADSLLRLAERERALSVSIVGDGMGRPIADALTTGTYDLSGLMVLASGGAMLSKGVKEDLRRALPGVIIADSFGASETGAQGTVRDFDGPAAGPRFSMGPQTTVLGDDGKPVAPGSGRIGKLARTGNIPLGYYKDPEKTAATFPVVDGVRWVVPGDFATIEADGSIVVLGRGSQTINSGGEKIFPEEVEDALRSHPDVFDALVCGIPDPRFTERVVALVQPREGRTPTLADLQAHCRTQLAGYKVPRELVLGPVQRTNIGKPDYVWARQRALEVLSADNG
jgi:fatty-acyl-CoA synthase